ncbi:gamma-aminobutyric acid type B receptor subunit 2-like [Lineus longissimus]|uniref:gamma-aminobutyric acid type B receptor subunit 2-like n=1 Tax=Lineus longissimus TaxID=88925 RepID=UPI002B4C78D7
MFHPRPSALATLVHIALFLGAINLVRCATNLELHVQGLFPLTGRQASRGYAELAGARLAMRRIKNPTDIQFAHNDSMCNVEIEAGVAVDAIATVGSNIILLGGGCQSTSSGEVLPQIIFESTFVSSSNLVINFRPTLSSLHPALISLIIRQGWGEVAIVFQEGHIYEKGSAVLRDLLKSRGIAAGLYLKDTNQNVASVLKSSTLRIVILYQSASHARDFMCNVDEANGRYRWLLPIVNSTDITRACQDKKPTVLTLSLKQVSIDRQFTQNIDLIYGIEIDIDIVSAAYSYDALSLIIRQSHNSTKNTEVITLIKTGTFSGATGLVEFGEDGLRLFQARIDAYVGNDFYSYGSFYSSLTRSTGMEVLVKLNVTERVKKVVEMEGVGLVFFAVMTSLAIIIITYAIAIMGYVIKMRDERFYKMTSPNINIVILLSAVLVCLHVVLIGFGAVKMSLGIIRDAHVASRYILCIAFSIFYGAVLMKTWRVYVIFKNLNANGKLTRDIVLVSVIFAMVIVDVILVSIWSFADPLRCDIHNTSMKYEAVSGVDRIQQVYVCWSDFQPLWVSLIYLYKAAILATCVYFAWQTRHVTLPSMQDAPYIYVVILNGAFIGVLLIPTLVLFPADEKLSFGVTSLALLYLSSANISLLFIPKVVTYRQIQKGLKKDDKLAFSESLKKTQEATERTGCLNSCFGSVEKDNEAWQEVLSVEIENLKATVKQKDATIRELTDRLYYGADKFQQYLTRRQPSAASLSNSNYVGESARRTNGNVHLPQKLTGYRHPNDTGQQVTSYSSSSDNSGRNSQRHSQACIGDSGKQFMDSLRLNDTGQLFTNNRRHSHTYSDHGVDNGGYRSRSSSKASRISVQIHSHSDDSTSTGDEDSIIPTPRMVMAPPVEQRSNLQAVANVAYVRSLEDISHDSAIENPPESSDKDSERIYNKSNHLRNAYTPPRPNSSMNRLSFPHKSEGTPGSDDSGIAAIYSPVNLPSIYSPMEYENQRNNLPTRFMYEEPMQADTIV